MFALAEALGQTVGEMSAKMGFEEFNMWMMYFDEKNRIANPEGSKNLLDGGEEAVLKGFGF